MAIETPHYLLTTKTERSPEGGQWRFMLRPLDGSPEVEYADVEPDVWGERLELLTVVRALESLDQPSWVTIIGCSRYIEQGVMFGISEWKENGWCWECFGQMVDVRDKDLWQRMDRVLNFHRVDCGQRRFDSGHRQVESPHIGGVEIGKNWINGLAGAAWTKCSNLAMIVCGAAWARTIVSLWSKRLAVPRLSP